MRLSLPVGLSSRSRTLAEARTTLQMMSYTMSHLVRFPASHSETWTERFALCLQQDELAALSMKTRKSQSDLNLKDIAETYGPLLQQDFSVDVAAAGSARALAGGTST